MRPTRRLFSHRPMERFGQAVVEAVLIVRGLALGLALGGHGGLPDGADGRVFMVLLGASAVIRASKAAPHQRSYRTSSDRGLRCLGLGAASG